MVSTLPGLVLSIYRAPTVDMIFPSYFDPAFSTDLMLFGNNLEVLGQSVTCLLKSKKSTRTVARVRGTILNDKSLSCILDKRALIDLVRFLSPIKTSELTVEIELNKVHVRPIYTSSLTELQLYASFQLLQASISSISTVLEITDGLSSFILTV